jgi:hypothetical protein
VKVELLHIPGCPHVEEARSLLQECLAELGLAAHVEEREGPYPSPTIRVDGQDVMGAPGQVGAACRLDRPTRERILAALAGAKGRAR